MKNKASEALQDLDPAELDAVVGGGGTWAQAGRAFGESLGRFGGMGDPKAGASMVGTIGEYAGRMLDTITAGGPTPTDTHQPGSSTDQHAPSDGGHPSDPQAPSGDTHDPTTNGANPGGDPSFGADPGNHGDQPAGDNTNGDFGPADHGASTDHTGDPATNGLDGDPSYGGTTGGGGDQSDTTYGDYGGGGDYSGDSGGGDF